MIEILNLHVNVAGKKVLNGLTLTIPDGEIHALMGPNGAGKSTLGLVLAGHPKCVVEQGTITFNGKNVLEMPPEGRSKQGMFLAFQYPFEIPGVTLAHFLFTVCRKQQPSLKPTEFRTKLASALTQVGLSVSFGERQLNVGLSGGEKKRCEIVQLLMLNPSFVVLDEADSGLDIDSLNTISAVLNTVRKEKTQQQLQFSCLLITHYSRILNYVVPDKVHVLIEGKIAFSGDAFLPHKLEQQGYGWLENDDDASTNNTEDANAVHTEASDKEKNSANNEKVLI